MHNASSNSEEKITLAAALTNFKQPIIINRSLEVITSEQVKIQDVAYWISYSFANRYAKDLTWEWLKSHWQWLENNIGNDLSFYMMPRYVARGYSDESFIVVFKQFFDQYMTDSFSRSINQAIESITWQSEWKKRDLKHIKDYFSAYIKLSKKI